MILDLSQCKSLDSRSIGAIVSLTNRFAQHHAVFVLRNAGAHIRKVLDFMNLSRFLTIESDSPEESAIHTTTGSLRVDYDVMENIGVFKFTGSIDTSVDSAMFLNIINKIISDGHRMLIDMSGISYIDSLGVGVIIRLIKLMREGKAEVRFYGANSALRDILETNHLDTIIHIHQTREEAVQEWL